MQLPKISFVVGFVEMNCLSTIQKSLQTQILLCCSFYAHHHRHPMATNRSISIEYCKFGISVCINRTDRMNSSINKITIVITTSKLTSQIMQIKHKNFPKFVSKCSIYNKCSLKKPNITQQSIEHIKNRTY